MPNIDLGGIAAASHVERPDGMPEGSRNWELYRYACSLQARGVSDEDMLDRCLATNATMDPPLTEGEVMTILRSAQTKPKGTGAAYVGRRMAAPRSVPEPPLLDRVGEPWRLPDLSALTQAQQARRWLMALFEPTDVVCLAWDMTAGYRGGHGGELYAYAGQLVDPGDPLLRRVLASSANGLWAVVNPLDGTGRRRGENVAAYRNLLIECDELDPDAQMERICALLTNRGDSGLPNAKTITWSGGKSWHAVVRIGNARNAADYAAAKGWAYRYCVRNGLPVDEKCGNPTRFTRVAGAMRGDVMQRLVYSRRPGKAWDGSPAEWAGRR